MRRLLVALFAVGLVVAPTFGATIDAKIQVTKAGVPVMALNVGDTAVVEGWFKVNSTTEALCAIGGSVTATAGSNLTVGTIPTDFSFYVANFQGFQPLLGEPGTDINPAQPVAGANGAVSSIGTAQGFANQISPSWVKTDALGRNNTWVKVFSYNVTAAAVGQVTLNWAEAAAGGNGGWYTTDTGMVNGVNTPTTSTTITVNPPPSGPATYVKASIDATGANSAKKTAPRFRNHVFFLFFNQSIAGAAMPTAADIHMYKYNGTAWDTAVDIFQVAGRTNWKFDVVNDAAGQPTVLRIWDVNNTAAVMTDKTWYEFVCTGTSKVNAFTVKFVTLRGDADGSGLVDTTDISNVVAKLGIAPNMSLSNPAARLNEQRYDLDGSSNVTGANVYTDGQTTVGIDTTDISNVVSKLDQTVALTLIP